VADIGDQTDGIGNDLFSGTIEDFPEPKKKIAKIISSYSHTF
jgi:hypothetical protein